jgi:hypothetical protein
LSIKKQFFFAFEKRFSYLFILSLHCEFDLGNSVESALVFLNHSLFFGLCLYSDLKRKGLKFILLFSSLCKKIFTFKYLLKIENWKI